MKNHLNLEKKLIKRKTPELKNQKDPKLRKKKEKHPNKRKIEKMQLRNENNS